MTVRDTQRPAPVSSGLAVVVAAAVLLTLAERNPDITTWIGVEVAGLGVVVLGTVISRRVYRLAGVAIAVVGGILALGAIGGFVIQTTPASDVVRLLPGFIGMGLLVGTLTPIRGRGSRTVVTAGAGCLFACVVLAGLFRTASLPLLLGAVVGTIVVWDVGEHAIGVGEQLGSKASTWRCEIPHLVATTLVGTVGGLTIIGTQRIAIDGLSFPAFAMVFIAVVLLLVALRS